MISTLLQLIVAIAILIEIEGSADLPGCYGSDGNKSHRITDDSKIDTYVFDGINWWCVVIVHKTYVHDDATEICSKYFDNGQLASEEHFPIAYQGWKKTLGIKTDFHVPILHDSCRVLTFDKSANNYSLQRATDCTNLKMYALCQYRYQYNCMFKTYFSDQPPVGVCKAVWQNSDAEPDKNCPHILSPYRQSCVDETAVTCNSDVWNVAFSSWSQCSSYCSGITRRNVSFYNCAVLFGTETKSCNTDVNCASENTTLPDDENVSIALSATTSNGVRRIFPDNNFEAVSTEDRRILNETFALALIGALCGLGAIFVVSGLVAYAISKKDKKWNRKNLGRVGRSHGHSVADSTRSVTPRVSTESMSTSPSDVSLETKSFHGDTYYVDK